MNVGLYAGILRNSEMTLRFISHLGWTRHEIPSLLITSVKHVKDSDPGFLEIWSCVANTLDTAFLERLAT